MCDVMILCGTHITDWLTAIGTIGAVFVSLFYGQIKRCWRRPKIKIDFEKDSPCFEEIKSSNVSSNVTDKRRIIRVRVTNEGRNSADYANVCIDAIYQQRNGNNSFVCKYRTPIQIKDYHGEPLRRVVPHLVYYLDVASIEKYEELTTANEKGCRKQFYKLFLLGDGRSEMLGTGTFILPIKFYFSNVDTKIMYLQIYWNSEDYTSDDLCLCCEKISETEFQKKIHPGKSDRKWWRSKR